MAFTPSQKQAISNLGTTVGQIFQDRFFQHQAQDFTQNELANFQQATSAFYSGLGEIEDPDQMAQAFTDWKNNTFMPFMTANAARYGRNPYIMQTLQQVDAANRNGLSQYLEIEQAAYERGQRGAEEERAQAEVGLIGAQTAAQEAGAEASQARAVLYRKQAQQVGAEGAQAPPLTSPMQLRAFIRQMKPAGRKNIRDEILGRAAQRYIDMNRGKDRGDGRVWGETPQSGETAMGEPYASDAEMAQDQVLNSVQWPKIFEAGVGQRFGGNEYLAMNDDYYEDVIPFFLGGSPVLPEEATRKMAGTQDDTTVISMLTATPRDQMSQTLAVSSVDEFIDKYVRNAQLPEGYVNLDPANGVGQYLPEELGPYMRSVFDNAIQTDQFGEVRSLSGEPIETYQDLQNALLASYGARVTSQMVAPGEQSQRTRRKVNEIGYAVVQRFTPIIASQLGIPIPKRAKQRRPKGGIDYLAESLMETLGLGSPEEAPQSEQRQPQRRQPRQATLEEERGLLRGRAKNLPGPGFLRRGE